MEAGRRTITGATLVSAGAGLDVVPHYHYIRNGLDIMLPVLVAVVRNPALPQPAFDDGGGYVYALPGGGSFRP